VGWGRAGASGAPRAWKTGHVSRRRAERLALSRSTIYYWVRDLPIPGSGPGGEWPEAARRKGTVAMQRKYRLLREAAYEQGMREYEELAADPTFRDFVCLYIAEGYKRDRNIVSIGNSDPAVVRLATRWMRRLSEKPPAFWIQYQRRPGSEEAARFLGRGACGWAGLDTHAAQVEQQSADGSHVAFATWCPHGAHLRDTVSVVASGVDGLSTRRVAIGSGVTPPGE
jgi:hypothetical protein